MYDGETGFDMIPPHMHDAVRRYVENGVHPGSFLEAIFTNDLSGAFGRADAINSNLIKNWVEFSYWHVPAICRGSIENFENWMRAGGVIGRQKSSKKETPG